MGNFLGGIAGDVIGSVYEWHNVSKMGAEFFKRGYRFTDDTVLTCAVADWLTNDAEHSSEGLVKRLRKYAEAHPDAGYGTMFRNWYRSDSDEPINSFGNGSGMRCSAVGYFAESYDEAMDLAKRSAEVTHNHPEGIKGAQAIACAIYMARNGFEKEEILAKLEKDFEYEFKRMDDIVKIDGNGNVTWRSHKFNATCQVTVPEAITAFFESVSYEDAIDNALLIGGDSDTIACMAGAIAGAFYGVPQYIQEKTLACLSEDLFEAVRNFEICLYGKLKSNDKA
jgi:ADP-ribosylglycohydrolase